MCVVEYAKTYSGRDMHELRQTDGVAWGLVMRNYAESGSLDCIENSRELDIRFQQ